MTKNPKNKKPVVVNNISSEKNSAHPTVTVICPTYNRRRFLPYLCHIFNYQTYPANRRELLILDDSETSNQDVINEHNKDNNITYIHHPEKLKLGKKRNMLNDMAKGEYIVCMDDDDYYPPEKISNAISVMKSRKAVISGSSEMYIYFTQLDRTYVFNKIGDHHATNGTFSYHRSFLKDHRYDDEAEKAEEKVFLKDYTAPMVQIEPLKAIVCIAHTNNTFDKNNIRQNLKPLQMKLKNFCKDKVLLNFYRSLAAEHATPEEEIVVKSPVPTPMMIPQVTTHDGKQLPVYFGQNNVPMVILPSGAHISITELEAIQKGTHPSFKDKENPEQYKQQIIQQLMQPQPPIQSLNPELLKQLPPEALQQLLMQQQQNQKNPSK